MKKALITAIMPLKYYRADFLENALESMMSQTSPFWRLLIVVEEPDYEHLSAVLKGSLKDPRIEMITTTGAGFTGSINTGMREAETDFVALLFADDKWSADAVEILTDNIKKYPMIDFFHSSRAIIDENSQVISPIYRSKENFRWEDFKWGSPVKHLLCWRREKGLSIGGIDEKFIHGPDDYDFPWSMLDSGAKFKAVMECLYYYRNHCDCFRLTTHIPLSHVKRGVNKILKKHGVGLFERKKIIAISTIRGSLGKQSIYKNSFDKWFKKVIGYDATRNWSQENYFK